MNCCKKPPDAGCQGGQGRIVQVAEDAEKTMMDRVIPGRHRSGHTRERSDRQPSADWSGSDQTRECSEWRSSGSWQSPLSWQ